MVPLSLSVRLAVFLFLWWYLNYDGSTEQREMASIQFRIQQYRRAAEYIGNRVIKLEKRYYDIADTNRMN